MDVLSVLKDLQMQDTGSYQITTIETLGDNVAINCPYHKDGTERTASFSILTRDKMSRNGMIDAGVGHCFACGASRSLPHLVKDILNQTTIEQGVEWLANNHGISISSTKQVRLLVPPAKEVPSTIPYKQYKVESHPFFDRRGINENSIALFDLGIDEAGGWAVFPIKDKSGNCQMIFRRSLEGKRFHNTAGAKKDNLLFGLNVLYENLLHYQHVQQIWIVESVIDAILLWQKGYPALAMLQAIPTEEQINLINALPFPELIIATDNDDAGHKGNQEFIKEIKGKTLFRLQYQPHQKDIGDFTQKEMEEMQIAQSTRQNIRRGLSLG